MTSEQIDRAQADLLLELHRALPRLGTLRTQRDTLLSALNAAYKVPDQLYVGEDGRLRFSPLLRPETAPSRR